jgi:hypothetical protein
MKRWLSIAAAIAAAIGAQVAPVLNVVVKSGSADGTGSSIIST